MSSTTSKRQQLWVCWQEPESDRGKFSLIPTSWVAKPITGDGTSPGSLVLCRWPRSEELFTAKILHDPSPNDLAQVEVMEVPMFMDESDVGDLKKPAGRRDRPVANAGANRGQANSFGGGDDGNFMMGQLKRFFLGEMSKMSGEIQTNFDILGHRIGALEVNMKCVRERVERIEKILNAAVNDLESQERDSSGNFLNLQARQGDEDSDLGIGRRTKTDAATAPKRLNQDFSGMAEEMDHLPVDGHVYDDGKQPQVIPRAPDQRVRKDRNPRPRAVVVTCPRNRNIVLLGGEEQYRMQLATYLDAIRHAKRPTATYMVTALLRRYLPYSTLAKLCVNERQLANTLGGQLVDEELLEALKKQGRMQFPQTSIVDRELMLRIEDVTRDVRRKIKLKRTMGTSSSPKKSVGHNSTPISMVAPQRSLAGNSAATFTKSRSRGFNPGMTTDDDGQFIGLGDADESIAGNEFDDNPEALPMFS